jgi:hypothetical protein
MARHDETVAAGFSLRLRMMSRGRIGALTSYVFLGKGGFMMRRIGTTVLFLGTLALLVGTGCTGDKDKDKKKTDSAKDGDVLVLEYEEIDLIPGEDAKEVKVKKGKASTAEAPKESGVTAKVEDGKLTVSAAKDAKEGTHEVKVKDSKGKDATLKVKVKKKE